MAVMRGLFTLVLLALAACLLPTAQAAAAPADGSFVLAQAPPITGDRSLTGGRSAPGQAAEPGFFSGVYNWILSQQQRLNRQLADAVKQLKAGVGFAAAWVLMAVGFTYGVLHAAGPGHGKAVISAYVLANERTVRRGIMLSFLAALFQALSAIALVGILAIALNMTSMAMRSVEHWIEVVSWGLVALVGAWLLYGQVRKILSRRRPAMPVVERHVPARAAAAAHTHTHDCGCDHAHMPDPKDLDGDLTWTKALAIAASVGIRPCTGAILILIFALSQGLFWAGVLATFAMALGTAITVSILASMALGSRELAARLGGGASGWVDGVSTAAGLIGASLVLLLGSVSFFAALHGPAPL